MNAIKPQSHTYVIRNQEVDLKIMHFTIFKYYEYTLSQIL